MIKLADVKACIFDAYGTLFDFASATARCATIPEEHRAALTALWREKQLQYTWLRALQRRYVDFETVTRDALDFALDSFGIATPERRDELMAAYNALDAFPEVAGVLRTIRAAGIRTAILSNGSPSMLQSAVYNAGLDDLLDAVLSVDALRTFKTDPAVYQFALDELGLRAEDVSFQSSNGWDAYAASDFGMRVVWCNRYRQRPERLPGAPDFEVQDLTALPDLLGLAM
ncbi:MAG: haloacid dehalogenase type II [Burkholderiales bacterium]|nr:haloacid dehalogenase type II [Burkholderiales bacterium]